MGSDEIFDIIVPHPKEKKKEKKNEGWTQPHWRCPQLIYSIIPEDLDSFERGLARSAHHSKLKFFFFLESIYVCTCTCTVHSTRSN